MTSRCWLPLAALLTLALPARADADEGSKVYKEVLKSVVWILSPRGGGKVSTGTGSLIDLDRHLLLTNYHVVGEQDTARVMFPRTERDNVVAERDYYRERFQRYGIRAKVVYRDKKADLAVIQLETVPDGAQAIKLAAETASPGQTVHSVGNPGGSGALWVYTPGKVRQVYHKKWKSKLEDRDVDFEAEIVETDSATNPGDSGGPLVNDKAQLVGVTQGYAAGARQLSNFIDLSEVKRILNTRTVKDVRTPEKTTRVASAVVVKDEAKFFSEGAVNKATEQVHELARKYDRDLLVETYPKVPADQVDKVKEMNAQERANFFRVWARARIKAQGLVGVYVLVCKEPSYVRVEVSNRAKVLFDEGFVKELVKDLLAQFRKKEYDEGLSGAVKMVSDKLAAEVKP
jgi:S1-C subfamily serine protease